MSYPLELQTLIVEDDESPKSYYEAVFDEFAKRYSLAKPRFAFCHEDAIHALESDSIFHLAILDLRLPQYPKRPAAHDLDYGLDLLARCANRNAYPIPAVFVISGYLDRANQSDLADKVSAGFAIGQVLTKGVQLESDIEAL